jgi:hypothetical protein
MRSMVEGAGLEEPLSQATPTVIASRCHLPHRGRI